MVFRNRSGRTNWPAIAGMSAIGYGLFNSWRNKRRNGETASGGNITADNEVRTSRTRRTNVDRDEI